MTPQEIFFRLANRVHLPSIVRMLADDDLGSQRERYETPLPESYYSAFEQIDDRQVRSGLPVGDRAAFHDEPAVHAMRVRELVEQA